MSEEKHSPLPWTASNQYLYTNDRTLPIASGQYDWATDRGGSSHEEAVANATLIVRSVNAVPALLAALEEARAFIEFELPSTGRKMVSAIDAALAAHRKES